MSINNAEYALPTELLDNINAAIDDWSGGKVARVWKKDADIWTGGEESKWLGWLDIADEEIVVCGMALGYEDVSKPENTFRTDRAPLEEWVTFRE